MPHANVVVPVAEIERMKSPHVKLITILLSYSDTAGECFPYQETIAERCHESLSWVRRHLREMQALEYFQVRRRRGSSVYLIAKRFLAWIKSAQKRAVTVFKNAHSRVFKNAHSEAESLKQNTEGESPGVAAPAYPPPLPDSNSDEELLAAARAQRAKLQLDPVHLEAELTKFRNVFRGPPPQFFGRWLNWALKAKAEWSPPRGDSPAKPQDPQSSVWRARLTSFRRHPEYWMPKIYGPAPGSAGCMAPPALLSEFGL